MKFRQDPDCIGYNFSIQRTTMETGLPEKLSTIKSMLVNCGGEKIV